VQEDFRLIVDLVLVLAAAAGGGPVGSAMPSTGFTGLSAQWNGQPAGTDKRVNSGRDSIQFGVAFIISPELSFPFREKTSGSV